MNRAALVAAALLGSLPLFACTTPVTAAAPKKVSGHPIQPHDSHEECVKLRPGDRLEYAFESSEPVDFNIHFHEGKAVVMPIVREKSRADAGVFAPPLTHDYCLMWEAAATGAVIDYRIRLRPATP